MKIRKIVTKIHLILGLISGAVVLIVALTGCIWAFEEEIRYLTQRDELYVIPRSTPTIPVSRVMTVVEAAAPAVGITQIRLFGDPARAIQVFTKNKRMLTANPYTGKLLANGELDSDWLLINLSLHRTLLLGDWGKKIVYWNAWIFLIMLLSGFVLWLPVRWRQWRASLRVKWEAKPAKRTYDLHSALGFYALPFLLVIVATGIDMASHGDKKKETPVVYAPFRSGLIADKALASVLTTDAVETVRVNLPKDSLNPLRVVIIYPMSGLRRESTFSFDPATAQLLEAKRYDQMTFNQRFWKSDYELHTGRILGFFGKCLAFVMGLVAASLPITGFLIWWGRRRKTQRNASVNQPVRRSYNPIKS